jgi:hypothetical protein
VGVRRLAFVAVVVVVLLVGGGLTSMILVGGSRSLFIQQTDIPDASTMLAAPWQAEQLVLLVGFLLFNLIGMAATIAVVMWLLHRGVKQVRSDVGTTAVTAAEGE